MAKSAVPNLSEFGSIEELMAWTMKQAQEKFGITDLKKAMKEVGDATDYAPLDKTIEDVNDLIKGREFKGQPITLKDLYFRDLKKSGGIKSKKAGKYKNPKTGEIEEWSGLGRRPDFLKDKKAKELEALKVA